MSDYGTSPNTKNELNFDNDEPQDAFQLNFDQFNNSEAVQSRKCVRPPRRHPLPRLSSNMSLNEVEAVLSKRLCEKLGRNVLRQFHSIIWFRHYFSGSYIDG